MQGDAGGVEWREDRMRVITRKWAPIHNDHFVGTFFFFAGSGVCDLASTGVFDPAGTVGAEI